MVAPFLIASFSDFRLRYDYALDQWNHCHEFDFTNNTGSRDHRSDDDDDDDHTQGPLHSLPEAWDSADPLTEVPRFNSSSLLLRLIRAQEETHRDLVAVWENIGDFFEVRYGVVMIHNTEDKSKSALWSTRLGLCNGLPSVTLVGLHESVVDGAWPKGVCDISPEIIGIPHVSPFPSTYSALRMSPVSNPKGYVITVSSGGDVGWKVFIRDPLTLLQIKREKWDSDPQGLIIGLIKKGIPFQILSTREPETGQFHHHPGPVIHPTGREPRYVDYLAYRQELVGFFAHYPHAYAAALSAGGIMWRIAMDVCPVPHQSDVTRRFHTDGCASLTIDGEVYWTPQLTVQEENVIVGVYKWAVCESFYSNP
jgi:hypothetical protein